MSIVDFEQVNAGFHEMWAIKNRVWKSGSKKSHKLLSNCVYIKLRSNYYNCI